MKRKILFLLFIALFIKVNGQQLVLTRDVRGITKNRITALKVTIDTYGDSIANQIFLGNIRIPGPLFVEYNNKLEFDSLKVYGRWNNCEKGFVNKMRQNIRKRRIFHYLGEIRHLPNDRIIAALNEGVSISLLADLYEPLAGKYKYFKEHQNPENYQFVDFVKELIIKWDKIGIEDIYGNIYYD